MGTEITPEAVRSRLIGDGATRQNSPDLVLVEAVIAFDKAIKAFKEASGQYPDDRGLLERLANEMRCRQAEMNNAREAAKAGMPLPAPGHT